MATARAGKRARDEPQRAAGRSWGPAEGENDGTAVRRSPNAAPAKAPKHDWGAGRKTTTSFSDDEDTFPPVRKTSLNGDGAFGRQRTRTRDVKASFQSAGERLDAENAAKGIPPAAARRGSVGDRHAHAHVAHGGASTSTARARARPASTAITAVPSATSAIPEHVFQSGKALTPAAHPMSAARSRWTIWSAYRRIGEVKCV